MTATVRHTTSLSGEAHTVSVERVTSFGDEDLAALCEAADAAIIDGGGFGWVQPPGRVALERYFRGLLLVPERLRHQGYGAEATAALEQALAAAGFSLLRLSVGDENPGALAFWERLGFAPVGRLDGGVTVLEKLLP
jgi:RimJ/RimL family protein N-acetyltransferase